jgi:Bacterial protein of unknown function (DUF937)
MATDLVSEIVEVVSPTISSRIASALGLDPAATQKAIVVAAPVLISALISYVSKAQGANKLNEVVRKQEPGMLSSLASVIGEPGQKALIDQGASVPLHCWAVRHSQVSARQLDNMPALAKSVLRACWGFLDQWCWVCLERSSVLEGSMLQASPTFSFRKRTTSALRCLPASQSTLAKLM